MSRRAGRSPSPKPSISSSITGPGSPKPGGYALERSTSAGTTSSMASRDMSTRSPPPIPNRGPAIDPEVYARLQQTNASLEAELASRIARINSMRTAHTAVVEGLKDSHTQQLTSMERRLKEQDEIISRQNIELDAIKRRCLSLQSTRQSVSVLEAALAEKDRDLRERGEELEGLKVANEALRGRIVGLESRGEMAGLRERVKEEVRKRENAETRLSELESRKQEEIESVTAQWSRQIDVVREEERKTRKEMEQQHSIARSRHENELASMRAQLSAVESKLTTADELIQQERKEKELLASKEITSAIPTFSSLPERKINEELVGLIKKINLRLAEEKRKNRVLTANIDSITSSSLRTVGDTQHARQRLASELEDLSTKLARVENEVSAIAKERDDFKQAWEEVCNELSAATNGRPTVDRLTSPIPFPSPNPGWQQRSTQSSHASGSSILADAPPPPPSPLPPTPGGADSERRYVDSPLPPVPIDEHAGRRGKPPLSAIITRKNTGGRRRKGSMTRGGSGDSPITPGGVTPLSPEMRTQRSREGLRREVAPAASTPISPRGGEGIASPTGLGVGRGRERERAGMDWDEEGGVLGVFEERRISRIVGGEGVPRRMPDESETGGSDGGHGLGVGGLGGMVPGGEVRMRAAGEGRYEW